MQDNRGPRIRFFDDLIDLQRAAYIAHALINWDLDLDRAANAGDDTYTFHFQRDGIEALLFAVWDIHERICRLNESVDKHFRDKDGVLIIDDRGARHASA